MVAVTNMSNLDRQAHLAPDSDLFPFFFKFILFSQVLTMGELESGSDKYVKPG